MSEQQQTHQGWDIAGAPASHQGPRESCWDPACERTENYFALDCIIDLESRFADLLDGSEPEECP